MKLAQIYERLDSISAFELQESWDNSGLIVGSFDDDIDEIVLSIDADEELLDSLKPKSLLITHHPLIFAPLKSINYNTYPSNLLQLLIKKGISNIAMHTNFDKTHLNAYVARRVLKVQNIEQVGSVVYFDVNSPFEQFATTVQRALSLTHLKCVKVSEQIRRVALIVGSGASMLDEIDADCLLTGDIKYHDAMKASSLGVSMIEIEHFKSERYFANALLEELNNLQLMAIISSSKDPFSYH